MTQNTKSITDNHLDVKGVKNIILGIGGIILDDSDQILKRELNLPEEQFKELNDIIFNDVRWRRGVVTGEIPTENYLTDLITEHPNYEKALRLAIGADNFDHFTPLYQPNIDLLKKLHETGKYKMYWLSNMNDTEYDSLKQKGIFDLLDGGIYSCVEHSRKPDPEFYQTLFNRYGLEPQECVFFDDRQHNLDAGEALGMHGELVPSLQDVKSCIIPYFQA